MVLLDRIDDWGPDFISGQHQLTAIRRIAAPRRPAAPAIAGIEIAGQAMAAPWPPDRRPTPKRGVLGSLRELALHADRLDDIAWPLAVHARLLTGWGKACAYYFTLQSGARTLIEGRAAVFFLFQ
jgi:predicted hotdog family 3-hydroxylacyl-ACP dehydratase